MLDNIGFANDADLGIEEVVAKLCACKIQAEAELLHLGVPGFNIK